MLARKAFSGVGRRGDTTGGEVARKGVRDRYGLLHDVTVVAGQLEASCEGGGGGEKSINRVKMVINVAYAYPQELKKSAWLLHPNL